MKRPTLMKALDKYLSAEESHTMWRCAEAAQGAKKGIVSESVAKRVESARAKSAAALAELRAAVVEAERAR